MQVVQEPEHVALDEYAYLIYRPHLVNAAEQAAGFHGLAAITSISSSFKEHTEVSVRGIDLPDFVRDPQSSPTLDQIRSILDSKCIVFIQGARSELPLGALGLKLYQYIPGNDQLFLFR